MIKLYELVANEAGVSPSPFVNMAELFLKHKGLEYEKIPLTFVQVHTEIPKVTNGEWSKVPTLVFPNGDIVYDTPKIAEYLDLNYPKNSIQNPDSKLDELISKYDSVAFPTSYQNIILDVYKVFDKDSAKYFKQTREQIFNLPWDQIPGDRQTNNDVYYNETKPINDYLVNSKFLDGDKPAFHDYALIGRIQTLKVISPRTYTELIVNNPGESFVNWVNSMEGLFDNFLGDRITV
ncbi:hypothetical protein CONCODRAFT_86223 [Conidiobolus coronatus NRRL 28638]|uniref:GST N-terminal domain-containing protein n=1 Tax=Conidiobolus coronatus (strain ATCC 28846 / CBS 209.66 / NRRL 28638) TaxID=796925 RepID=A0A137P1M2_CONC2|nr:hypothetical protein CONCODRAFT_86223 [Conidiobolus coronatus NRRL 28638]|eukprot:KXN68912.1 hypothetical protein CONCODRAFT_86223 [Conidiobolus coronatus NRRL 28638]